MTALTLRSSTGEVVPMTSFPSSALRNSTADVMEQVLTMGGVVITRHEKDKAVILSVEAFRRLVEARRDELEVLRAKFGGLLLKMQTPAARKGIRDAFDASPGTMGKAAVKAVRRRG